MSKINNSVETLTEFVKQIKINKYLFITLTTINHFVCELKPLLPNLRNTGKMLIATAICLLLL